MDNHFDLTLEDDKEMASPKMEEQFTMSNEEKYQATDYQPSRQSRLSNTGRRRRSSQGVITQEQRRERKKEIDKASRQRRKEKENKMKENLHILSEENASIKMENQVLMTETDSMAQNLQAAANETGQLESEILTLNLYIAALQQLVDSYSNQLVASNTSHLAFELRQLEIENSILRQTDWENWDSEKKLLLQYITGLEVKNKNLKLKHQALSEFVNTDEDGQQGDAA